MSNFECTFGCSMPTICTGVGKTVEISFLTAEKAEVDGYLAARARDLTYGNICEISGGAKIC